MLKRVYISPGSEMECYIKADPDSPNKPWVLFLHGMSEYCEKYIHIYNHLFSLGFQIVAPSLRGHGKSNHHGDDRRAVYIEHFDDYGRDVESLLEKLNLTYKIKSVSIVCHSMGGLVAADIVHAEQLKVNRVFYCAPMFSIKLPIAKNIALLFLEIFHFFKIESRLFFSKKLPDPVSNEATNNIKLRSKYIHHAEQKGYLQWGPSYGWLKQALLYIDEMPLNDIIKSVPSIVMLSGQDEYVNSKISEKLCKKNDVPYIWFENAKHELMVETPEILELFLSEMDKFLTAELK